MILPGPVVRGSLSSAQQLAERADSGGCSRRSRETTILLAWICPYPLNQPLWLEVRAGETDKLVQNLELWVVQSHQTT